MTSTALKKRSFDILEGSFPIHHNYLVEASAGTGKTYSIENLVIRLLLEEDPNNQKNILIDQILVVTFTRAAAQELKRRIHEKLLQTLKYLQDCLEEKIEKEDQQKSEIPPYLKKFSNNQINNKKENFANLWKAKQKIGEALACFQEAAIFTLHGFCFRMLNEYGSLAEVLLEDSTLSQQELMDRYHQIAKDFLRTALVEPFYSPAQVKIVLKKHLYNIDSLARALVHTVNMGVTIDSSIHYEEAYLKFIESIKTLQKKWNLSAEQLLEDFILLSTQYKKIADRKGNIYPEVIENAQFFSSLLSKENPTKKDFEKLINNGCVWLSSLDPKNLKAKKKQIPPDDLNYPGVLLDIQQAFSPIIFSVSNYFNLFARMAKDFQKHLDYVKEVEQLFSPDDLLKKMLKTLEHSTFSQKIKLQFSAAIIDEFQDTDPVQWNIFQEIFLTNNWQGYLYLVGDPKQSIYAFRNADIYTYLNATKMLGDEQCVTLGTNYRSQSSLIESLNWLFSQTNEAGLLPLPRAKKVLPFDKVKSNTIVSPLPLADSLGSVHFFIGEKKQGRSSSWPSEALEEEQLFPFIVEQISNLHQKDQIPYSGFAILVRDRYQAIRVKKALDRALIPSLLHRKESLKSSKALFILKDLLTAIKEPQNLHAVKKLLSSSLIEWDNNKIKAFQEQSSKDSSEREQIISKLFYLKTLLLTVGFSQVFEVFFSSDWDQWGKSLKQNLFEKKEGEGLYRHLQQLAELLVKCESESNQKNPDLLLNFLEQSKKQEYEENLLIRQGGEKNAVTIMTLHMSKGLEFDIVFALGVANRTPVKDGLIRMQRGKEELLVNTLAASEEELLSTYEELDAEKMRQLYVALTRAKYRVYIPLLINSGEKKISFGAASPIELFIARVTANTSIFDLKDWYEWIQNFNLSAFCSDLKNSEQKISFSYAKESKEREQLDNRPLSFKNFTTNDTHSLLSNSLIKNTLIEPKKLTIPGKPLFIQSFSSMNYSVLRRTITEDPPHDFHAEIKTPHTLPSGSAVGVFLHHLFETISFSSAKKLKSFDDFLEMIKIKMDLSKWHAKFKGWEPVIAKILWNTFLTPLKKGDDTFCLADINEFRSYKEMEFLYQSKNSNEKGYKTGIIDLTFEHQGKAYLLDWKSNWLGSDHSFYSTGALKQVMEEHHYFTQANFYKEALLRYIKRFENSNNSLSYGGIFYLFIRGIENVPNEGLDQITSNTSDSGIYYFNE